MGPAVASRHGAATTSDADFASILGEATAPVPDAQPVTAARPAAPAKPPPPAPVEDQPADDTTELPVVDAAVLPDLTPAAPILAAPIPVAAAPVATADAAPSAGPSVAPAPAPAPAPVPALPPAPADIDSAAAADAAAPAPAAPPAPADPSAAPALTASTRPPVPRVSTDAATPSAAPPAAPAAETIDAALDAGQTAVRAAQAEQSKTAAPTAAASAPAAAPLLAAMAAQPIRPAKPAAEAPTQTAPAEPAAAEPASVEPISAEAVPVVEEPAPDTRAKAPAAPSGSAATAAPLETPRTRDVIDRAQTGRSSAPDARTAETATPRPEGAAATDGATVAAPAPSPSDAAPRPAPAFEAAMPPTLAAESPTAVPGAQSTPTGPAPLESAASLTLSQTSRVSIETTAQIAAQIIRNHQGRSTRFDMVLTPDSLGQVDVSLEIAADGKLAARLAFDNPLAATEMRGRVDELRRQLQEAGFTVADDALSFSERDPSAAGQGGAFDRRPDPRNARAFGAGARLSADADLTAATGRWIPLALTPDRVDMKV